MPSPIRCRIRPKVIVDLRARKGWTQKELAKKAGVSRRTVASLEAGTASFAPVTIGVVSRALGVSPESLVRGRKKQQEAVQQIANPLHTEQDEVLIIVVMKGKREAINEALPILDLGTFSKLIADGVLLPLAIENGSIRLTGKMHLFAALELLYDFGKGRWAGTGLLRIDIPLKYAYLVPRRSKDPEYGEDIIRKAAIFTRSVPISFTRHIAGIGSAFAAGILKRRASSDGYIELRRRQPRRAVNT